jgi:hypothetical protein
MRDFKAKNTGNRIVINPAPYKTAITLKNVLLNELKNNILGLKVLGNKENVLEKEIDFTGCIDFIKNVLIGADISETVNKVIFDCLGYCTYNTVEAITESLFDKIPEAREDYYEIIIACIEENLKPFMKSLASEWSILAPKLGESQALNVIFQSLSK